MINEASIIIKPDVQMGLGNALDSFTLSPTSTDLLCLD